VPAAKAQLGSSQGAARKLEQLKFCNGRPQRAVPGASSCDPRASALRLMQKYCKSLEHRQHGVSQRKARN
jgi:hypothetical protein